MGKVDSIIECSSLISHRLLFALGVLLFQSLMRESIEVIEYLLKMLELGQLRQYMMLAQDQCQYLNHLL